MLQLRSPVRVTAPRGRTAGTLPQRLPFSTVCRYRKDANEPEGNSPYPAAGILSIAPWRVTKAGSLQLFIRAWGQHPDGCVLLHEVRSVSWCAPPTLLVAPQQGWWPRLRSCCRGSGTHQETASQRGGWVCILVGQRCILILKHRALKVLSGCDLHPLATVCSNLILQALLPALWRKALQLP